MPPAAALLLLAGGVAVCLIPSGVRRCAVGSCAGSVGTNAAARLRFFQPVPVCATQSNIASGTQSLLVHKVYWYTKSTGTQSLLTAVGCQLRCFSETQACKRLSARACKTFQHLQVGSPLEG